MRRRRTMLRSASPNVPKSWPSSSTRPELGGSMPPSTCSRLLLPQPEGPMMARNSPGSTRMLTPRSACTCAWPAAPYCLQTSRVSSTAIDRPMSHWRTRDPERSRGEVYDSRGGRARLRRDGTIAPVVTTPTRGAIARSRNPAATSVASRCRLRRRQVFALALPTARSRRLAQVARRTHNSET